MDPRDLETPFREFVAALGLDLETTSPSEGVPAMLQFFCEQRADGCEEPGTDQLLFQWGAYDWGPGTHFEIDITRQVILPDEEDDDAIWQLHLTYRFIPTDDLIALGWGNRWCESAQGCDAFASVIRGTPAFRAVASRVPLSVDVFYECAG
ncbi:MAG TPA: hypothetical protein VF384_12925 [Planctomycetota bacterium]